jgi:NTE family protein
VRAQITIDQLDDPLFPRAGYYLFGSVEGGLGSLDERFNLAQAKGLWAVSHGRHTLNVALEGGGQFGLNGDNRNNDGFFLGGLPAPVGLCAGPVSGQLSALQPPDVSL